MKEKLKIKYLEQQIRAVASGENKRARLPFGIAAIDAILPGGGLALGALHELQGAQAEGEGGAAVAAAFLAGILARLAPERPVLWCLEEADLYVPGLALLGLVPHRLILARAANDQEILWAMEEGLRCRALAAVVGEVKALPALASRRLQLAAESAGVTGFALCRGAETATSTATTRWRIAALPGVVAAGEPGVGQALWRVDLLRCRGGVPASWIVEAPNATGHVALSAALADRVLSPPQRAVG